MSITKLNLIKKNRVYFACEKINGFKCKLRITKESENLSLGWQDLFLKDVSVSSKFGTDYIYEVIAEVKPDEIVSLKHRYNIRLVEACRNLGGSWLGDQKAWVFPAIVADKIEELDWLYNIDVVNIEIKCLQRLTDQPSINFKGYPLVEAAGRDSGATVCDNVALISGNIGSGGSMKNWVCIVEEGSIFRIEISKNLLKDINPKYWEVKILNGDK